MCFVCSVLGHIIILHRNCYNIYPNLKTPINERDAEKNSSEVDYFVLYASPKLGPVATIYNLLMQSNIVHLMGIRMYSTYTAANSNKFSIIHGLSDVFMYVFQVDDTLGNLCNDLTMCLKFCFRPITASKNKGKKYMAMFLFLDKIKKVLNERFKILKKKACL